MPILKKNLSNLKFLNNYSIIEKNILNKFDFKILEFKFDIIFLDPPYKENNLSDILKSIFKHKVLKKKFVFDCFSFSKKKYITWTSSSIK